MQRMPGTTKLITKGRKKLEVRQETGVLYPCLLDMQGHRPSVSFAYGAIAAPVRKLTVCPMITPAGSPHPTLERVADALRVAHIRPLLAHVGYRGCSRLDAIAYAASSSLQVGR